METIINQEKIYKGIAELAVSLYEQGKTMTCDELLNWINTNYPQDPLYGGVRGVLPAAYRRVQSEYEKKALSKVFTDKNGNCLVQD